jgi:hypothetical protein
MGTLNILPHALHGLYLGGFLNLMLMNSFKFVFLRILSASFAWKYGISLKILCINKMSRPLHNLIKRTKLIANRCKVMIQAAESGEDGNREAEQKSQKTVSGALYAIGKREGLLGFFKGLHAQILKTVLSSALLLMIKEKITKTTWVLMLALKKYLFVTRTRLKKSTWISDESESYMHGNLIDEETSEFLQGSDGRE